MTKPFDNEKPSDELVEAREAAWEEFVNHPKMEPRMASSGYTTDLRGGFYLGFSLGWKAKAEDLNVGYNLH